MLNSPEEAPLYPHCHAYIWISEKWGEFERGGLHDGFGSGGRPGGQLVLYYLSFIAQDEEVAMAALAVSTVVVATATPPEVNIFFFREDKREEGEREREREREHIS